MKIAFVTFGNFSAHATLKRATGMAGPLIEAGHEVAILLEDASDNREKVQLECPDATVFWHQRGTSGWAERRAKQKTLNEWKPDIVWVCGVGLRNWITRPKLGCLLLGEHCELLSAIQSDFSRHVFYVVLEWLYCLHFDGQICASRYLERFYRRRLRILGRKECIHYSAYANNNHIITPPDCREHLLLTRFSGKKVILYMGSFWSNYGFWDMLHAFRQLALLREDFVAVMIGQGPEKENGIEWLKEQKLENFIQIEGYVAEEDLSLYFSTAHAFLCPMRDTIQDWARCPSKLFMYLPFRRPVVTCKIGEAAELFGEAGCYYKPGDRDSLFDKLNEVLNDPGQFSTPPPEAHTYQMRVECFLAWLANKHVQGLE